jgi:hypothetical protein
MRLTNGNLKKGNKFINNKKNKKSIQKSIDFFVYVKNYYYI